MKYKDVEITFLEVPDEISLCINITNCPYRCKGCHSPYLREDIGEELNEESLEKLIDRHNGITCVAFMGGDSDIETLEKLAKFVRESYPNLKICWYSGNDLLPINRSNFDFKYLDYIKSGSYHEDLGGLNSPTTNQRFYEVIPRGEEGFTWYYLENLNHRFL